MASFSPENHDGVKLAQAKKAAARDAPPNRSWWIGQSREAFHAEVKRRHACLLNSRNPSVRSLAKVI